MITVPCTCGKKLSVKPEHAGKRVKCPGCQSLLQVPKRDDEIRIVEAPNEDDGLRIMDVDDAPVPANTSSPGKKPAATCAEHPPARAVGKCMNCEAPICSDCRKAFGYYCSMEHKSKTAARPARLEPSESQSAEDRRALERTSTLVKRVFLGIVGSVVAIILFFILGAILDTAGTVRWEADLEGEIPERIVKTRDGLLVLTTGGHVRHLSADGSSTGNLEMAAKPAGFGSVNVVGELGIVSDGHKTHAISLVNGKVAWTYPAPAIFGWRDEIPFDKNHLFLTIRRTDPSPADAGKIQQANPDSSVESPLRLIGGATRLAALDRRTGKERWTVALSGSTFSTHVAAEQGHVSIKTTTWEKKSTRAAITVYDADSGAERWNVSTESRILGDPLPTSLGLVVITDSGLRSYAWADGSEVWATPLRLKAIKKSQRVLGKMMEVTEKRMRNLWLEGTAIFLHIRRALVCVEMATGKIRWRIDAQGRISELVEAGGVLVCSGHTTTRLSQVITQAPIVIGADKMAKILDEEFEGGEMDVPISMALDAVSGKRLWTLSDTGRLYKSAAGVVLHATDTRMNLFAKGGHSPFISQSRFLLLDPATGEAHWEKFIEDSVGQVVVSEETIYYAATRGSRPVTLTGSSPSKMDESKIVALWLQ